MPKKTSKKNNKGAKVAEVTKTKETKKVEVTKDVKAKEVSEKKVKKATNKKKGNGKIKAIIAEVSKNTPFVIALCAVVILIAALIFALCVKRVPKTSKGEEILATVKGETITANDLYESLKESYGTDSLINLIDKYIANKEVEITKENEEYVDEVVDYYKEYAEYYKVDLATFLASYVGLTGIETEEQFRNYVLEDSKKHLLLQIILQKMLKKKI